MKKNTLYDKYKDHDAIGKSCVICMKEFKLDDIIKSAEISKHGIENGPVKMKNIPGWMHRRCRGTTTVNIIQNSTNFENLDHMT